MYKLITQKLKEREKPINVAIVGCGWFGSRLAREVYRIPGTNPKVLIDKNIDKAVAIYLEMGVNRSDIAIVKNSEELERVQSSAKYIVFSNLALIKKLNDIDVVYEATGNIMAGAQATLSSFEAGIHFVTINYEMDATIGLILSNLALSIKVILS